MKVISVSIDEAARHLLSSKITPSFGDTRCWGIIKVMKRDRYGL